MIEIKKIESGFQVHFPFSLKDSFRATFKTAKWNADERRWEVGTRSEARLRQWAEQAQEAAEAIVAGDDAAMAEEELVALRERIEATRSRKESAEAYLAKLKATRMLIQEASEALASVAKTFEAVQEVVESEQCQIEALLKSVVDLGQIRREAATMAANMVPADRGKKSKFEDARAVVKSARDRLRDAGLVCSAISRLASSNVNRPDRDHPKDIAESEWFNISKVEKDY